MKHDTTLRLTPAQIYNLRQLVANHADCHQAGWAELKQALDTSCVNIARNEITYGAVPAQEFKRFNSARQT